MMRPATAQAVLYTASFYFLLICAVLTAEYIIPTPRRNTDTGSNSAPAIALHIRQEFNTGAHASAPEKNSGSHNSIMMPATKNPGAVRPDSAPPAHRTDRTRSPDGITAGHTVASTVTAGKPHAAEHNTANTAAPDSAAAGFANNTADTERFPDTGTTDTAAADTNSTTFAQSENPAREHYGIPGNTGNSTTADILASLIDARIRENLVYPKKAQARGIEGTAILQLTATPDGTLQKCIVTGSSGSTILDAAAKDIAEKAFPVPVELLNRRHPVHRTETLTVSVSVKFSLRQ